MNVQAYLLAAGRGRRAGQPKAWLVAKDDRRPLLERHLDFLLTLLPPEGIAVSIQEPWLKRCRALAATTRWVAVDPDRPPLAALQALLRDSPMRAPSFVFHVDMPVWNDRLFERLADSVKATARPAVPTFGGRRGHPVALPPSAQAELLALDAETGRLDRWLSGKPVDLVEGAWPCAVENWNEGSA